VLENVSALAGNDWVVAFVTSNAQTATAGEICDMQFLWPESGILSMSDMPLRGRLRLRICPPLSPSVCFCDSRPRPGPKVFARCVCKPFYPASYPMPTLIE
jgi:hypothetical protein